MAEMTMLDLAGQYWDLEIAPGLGILPTEGFTFLRARYVADVMLNEEALKQIQEWAADD